VKLQYKNILYAVCFGCLWLFGAQSVSALTQNEVAKLLASDGAAGDRFGQSVSLDGDTVVIGANGVDDNGNGSGAVYVFVRNATVWTEQAKLLASDGAGNDEFGSFVSLDGDTVVIGVLAVVILRNCI